MEWPLLCPLTGPRHLGRRLRAFGQTYAPISCHLQSEVVEGSYLLAWMLVRGGGGGGVGAGRRRALAVGGGGLALVVVRPLLGRFD